MRHIVLAGLLVGCAGDAPGGPGGGERGADAGGLAPDGPDAATGVVPRPDAAPGTIESTFDTDLDGWLAGDAGGTYDEARFLDEEGHPGGAVFLDGSDGGTSDGEPNSWVHRAIDLPHGAVTLKFDTRAAIGNDGALRVRLITASDESHDVLAWEVLSGGTWVSRSADLSAFAGQSVRLLFEQGDDDVGQGEMRYLDNIRID